MKYLIILLMLVGCNDPIRGADSDPISGSYSEPINEHKMKCEDVARRLIRCENTDAICYKYVSEDLECIWKVEQ